jgi:hypothetical protein
MLFEPGRHEPLQPLDWDEARARQAIADIAHGLQTGIGDGLTYPQHPLDAGRHVEPPHKSLYLGSAGTLWALDYLRRQGAATVTLDAAERIAGLHTEYTRIPDTGKVVPSYFLGEVGILLAQYRAHASAEVADKLERAIRANIPNPANEALWAAPGTMVGALHMLDWTGEERWKTLFLENVEHLWSLWQPSAHAGCHLWTQDLYGEVVQLLGSGHGFAGNAYPMLRGAAHLPPATREALYERCEGTLAATALHDGGGVNWPPQVGPSRAPSQPSLLQWCHGAPGVITGFAHFPAGRSARIDTLLVRAGETTWRAGPLAKGYGTCHGTAGNGYALLELFKRTGDTVWLDRARRFAMHAIIQAWAMRERYGMPRYTVWTGEAGLAVYLWHCIAGGGGMPTLEIL